MKRSVVVLIGCMLSGTLRIVNLGDQTSTFSYVKIYLSDGESYLKRVSTGKLKPGGEKSSN